ncbi:hypothetical protein D3C78_1334800 [compost metagenome]
MIVRQLPHHQEHQRHHGHDGQDNDLGRVEPVQLLALIEHDLQRTDANHQQHQPDGIDRFDLGFGLPAFQRRHCNQDHEQPNRDVDKEDPAPVIVIADITAQDRPENRRDDHGHRP